MPWQFIQHLQHPKQLWMAESPNARMRGKNSEGYGTRLDSTQKVRHTLLSVGLDSIWTERVLEPG